MAYSDLAFAVETACLDVWWWPCDVAVSAHKNFVEGAEHNLPVRERAFKIVQIFSVSRSTHGNLPVTYIPRGGILIGHHVPSMGNFGMVAILDNTVCYIYSSRKQGNHLLLFCDQCFNTVCNK